MKKNLGTRDRIYRLEFAVFFGIGAFLAGAGALRIVLGLASLACVYEALASWCIVYALLGKNTCPTSQKNKN
jgi:hypothetical protein